MAQVRGCAVRYAPPMLIRWTRRLLTLAVVAAATAGGALWWLYDGDLEQGARPVVDDVIDGVEGAMDVPPPGEDAG